MGGGVGEGDKVEAFIASGAMTCLGWIRYVGVYRGG